MSNNDTYTIPITHRVILHIPTAEFESLAAEGRVAGAPDMESFVNVMVLDLLAGRRAAMLAEARGQDGPQYPPPVSFVGSEGPRPQWDTQPDCIAALDQVALARFADVCPKRADFTCDMRSCSPECARAHGWTGPQPEGGEQ
jgi:hypothetical protein